MKKVKVKLQPIVHQINLPTVIKTAILPGDSYERLFIATQVGEIYYTGNENLETFLDIRSRVINLGSNGGYDERGLLGLAFHPEFYYNGLFYLHYSKAGTQGPGVMINADEDLGNPQPCDPKSLNLEWRNRDTQYDHVDTVEEWIMQPSSQPQRRRTLLNLRRPFSNHNGVNSLNFSPETRKLILTTGDGGSGYDPFNLSQDDMEIAGKIIEIDVHKQTFINEAPVVSRFDELPVPIQDILSVMAKGVRNMSGISFQRLGNQYTKYVGNVGQGFVESVFSFVKYNPIPVKQLIQDYLVNPKHDQEGLVNFGWRGWEGTFPTSIIRGCPTNPNMDEKVIAFYNEAAKTVTDRLQPLTCYYHKDPRRDKFEGTALTGVKPYMGDEIPDLKRKVLFIDLSKKSSQPSRGVLAYTDVLTDCKVNDYGIIETEYNFSSQAFYVSLGTNIDQTRMYLGVYGSMRVTDFNQGSVFEIVL